MSDPRQPGLQRQTEPPHADAKVAEARGVYGIAPISAGVPAAHESVGASTIPKDWDMSPLGSLFRFANGVNADKEAYGHGTPFVNVLEVITHSHLHERHIPGKVALSRIAREAFAVLPGDVLFNRTSETQEEVGLAAVYCGRAPVVFGGFVIRGRPFSKLLDSTYAGYGLRAPSVRQQIVAQGQGAIRSNIGQANLRRVQVPMPPPAEQRAIAEALSDVDGLLATLDALIAKKRAIKQAAMQQLLTGKSRLPGYSETWVTSSLGELSEIRSGGTPSTGDPTAWGGDIPWCTPTDITALDGHKYLAATSRTITAHGLKNSSAELIPTGSVIMTSRATIGECAVNLVPVTTNQGFKNFVPSERVHGEFLYYLLTTQKAGFVALCGGSTFLEIGKAQLRSYEVRIPLEYEEQRAIATVLSDMDSDISALERRREKTRAIKQGMLQQLLTGRVRLIEPSGDAHA